MLVLLTLKKRLGIACAGFVALGDMAMALAKAHSAKGMEGCLDAVAAQIREAIAPPAKGRSRTHSPEALNVRSPS
jgi:hypothetical protein